MLWTESSSAVPGASSSVGRGKTLSNGARMAVRTPSSSRRWWQRLLASDEEQPYGLTDDWVVVPGPVPRTEVVVGPGGAFLLDHRRTRLTTLARMAGEVSGRLTARLGSCVSVHGVLVEEAQRPVRADQPAGVTIVTAVVLGAWLRSHPRVFDERQVRQLASALRPPAATGAT